MRVLLAFDKFKHSLTAREACDAAARALRGRHPDWRVEACPLTDGGEGFADILTRAAGGRTVAFRVEAPRGGLIEAPVGLVAAERVPAAARALLGLGEGTGSVAIVEMASASGLALLPPELRDPWQATSRGTGQLIRAAAELGAGAVLLGVGGSATHDLGLGALSALGLEFRSGEGGKFQPPLPAQWRQIARIEGEVFPSIPPIRIACDVSNPLLGARGAAAVYAPQKGLRPEELDRLESDTARMAGLLSAHCGAPASLASAPGGGAAGGIAFGLVAAARARLVPGFELVAAWLGLDARLAEADLVLTGEGRFDASSLEGKGPGAVAALGLRLDKPVHVFAGQVAGEAAGSRPNLFFHAITPADAPLDEALAGASRNLAAAVGAAF